MDQIQSKRARRIVVIGASAGGTEALKTLMAGIDEDSPAAFFIVRHIHPESVDLLAQILDRVSKIRVTTAGDGVPIEAATAYVGPPGYHLVVDTDRVRLVRSPLENHFRPSIDTLFRTAAMRHRGRVIGVILSGMLDDGAAGIAAVKVCGGIAIVQDPKDAQFSQMPSNALDAVQADHIAPVSEIPSTINELVLKPPPEDLPGDDGLLAETLFSSNRQPRSTDIGPYTDYSCPDCGGPLHEAGSSGPRRYRCAVGHAYSRLALVDGQQAAIERAMWGAVRLLDERSLMLRRLAAESAERGSTDLTRFYEQRQQEAAEQAVVLRDFLTAPQGSLKPAMDEAAAQAE